jgi:hypothetical protein
MASGRWRVRAAGRHHGLYPVCRSGVETAVLEVRILAKDVETALTNAAKLLLPKMRSDILPKTFDRPRPFPLDALDDDGVALVGSGEHIRRTMAWLYRHGKTSDERPPG